jgi:hypothetical protein
MTGAERTFKLKCDEPTAFQAAIEAIEKEGFELLSNDSAKGTIRARKGVSPWSWGEVLDLDITAEANHVLVNVSSASLAQIVDWGTNEVNVERVGRRLTLIAARLTEGSEPSRPE